MLIYTIVYSITIIIESFIITYKFYNRYKLRSYILNCLILIADFIIMNICVNRFSADNNIDKLILYSTLLLIIIDAISIINFAFKKRNSAGEVLIKHTIDTSDSGIIALNNQNRVMFQNSIMYNLMEKLEINNNYIKNIIEKSVEKIGNDYIVLIDDKAWLFCISKDEKEINAFNIDEEYKLQKELEKQNKKINKNNEELLWTIENLEELEREEKTLRIKNKFHDVLGQNLAVLKMYLNKEIEDEEKFAEIKFMIKKMFTELEDTEEAETNLNDLIKINENLGIKIDIVGKLPEDKQKAKVMFEIIREAVTNAVRHANSTQINVVIEDKLSGLSMTITNNGTKPKETIVENEGIKGMRRKVKKINGNIYIKTVPEFSVQVEM